MTRQQFLSLPPGYSEDVLQSSAHLYMNHNYPPAQHYGRYFSVPNGGTRHKIEANKLKATGLTPGIHDYFIVSRTGRFIPIEFKVPGTGLTGKQPLVHATYSALGIDHYTVRTPSEFLTIIDKHF